MKTAINIVNKNAGLGLGITKALMTPIGPGKNISDIGKNFVKGMSENAADKAYQNIVNKSKEKATTKPAIGAGQSI